MSVTHIILCVIYSVSYIYISSDISHLTAHHQYYCNDDVNYQPHQQRHNALSAQIADIALVGRSSTTLVTSQLQVCQEVRMVNQVDWDNRLWTDNGQPFELTCPQACWQAENAVGPQGDLE